MCAGDALINKPSLHRYLRCCLLAATQLGTRWYQGEVEERCAVVVLVLAATSPVLFVSPASNSPPGRAERLNQGSVAVWYSLHRCAVAGD